MDYESMLLRLRSSLEELSEFDGDASWYKDNSRHINEIIEIARQLPLVAPMISNRETDT